MIIKKTLKKTINHYISNINFHFLKKISNDYSKQKKLCLICNTTLNFPDLSMTPYAQSFLVAPSLV